ncbi:MAG: XRE family transcriptional regulator [Gammaproteobacteria bacterium]|nr:XRE family transcriptional regulator [Gammaproteobacteria bacterium]
MPSESLGPFVGATLKAQRQAQRLTIQDVATLCGISRGMLSRIENDQAMPSLDTLQRVCRALGLSLANFFKDYDLPEGIARHVPQGEGMKVVRRGTKRGHTYELLSYDQGPQKLFEPFLITLDDQSEVFPRFQHPGVEFIYMLKGRIDYRHGNNVYRLKPGDSLTFQGDIPHGPERLVQMPIQFLAIMHYGGVSA